MSQRTMQVMMCLVGVLSAAGAAAGPAAACRAHGQAALQAWSQGDEAGAGKDFAPAIAAKVTPDALRQGWAKLQGLAGPFRRLDALQPYTLGGRALLAANVEFAKMPMVALVDCDTQDRITTFRIVPASSVPAVGASMADASAYVVRDVAVPSPPGPLAGILTLPRGKGPFPAVVLVAGSGPHDRDETIGPNKPFRDLAEGLAAAGIASLRYDKRTFAYGRAMAGTEITVDDEVTDDALAALRLLAQQPGVDPHRLFVLGHSLGGMMAPRIGERDLALAGLILLAAPARSLLDVSEQQVRELGPKQGLSAAQIDSAIRADEDEKKLLVGAGTPQGTFRQIPQSYWLSLSRYDQVAAAEKLHMPMLFLQGGSDFQVSPTADFARWQQAFAGRKGVAFRLYPGLSHLFMPAGDPPSLADYDKPAHLDARVIRDMADWIKAQPPAG